MYIQLDHVSPSFLPKNTWQHSEIWGRGICFSMNSYYQIIAPSGSGKSSLINFIYGLRKDYEGKISYDAKDLGLLNIENFSVFRQKHISIVFQDMRLFKDKTCIENIEIKRQLHPFYPKEMIYEMAEKLGVVNKLDQQVNICSYGEQQRIAIIRSLMQPFEFLLLDEPFSHLDHSNKSKALQLIDEACKQRKASLIFADLEYDDFFKNHHTLYL